MIVTGILAVLVGLSTSAISLASVGDGISARAARAVAVLGLLAAFGGAVLLDTTMGDDCVCAEEVKP